MYTKPIKTPPRIFVAGLGASGGFIAAEALREGAEVHGLNRSGCTNLDGVTMHAADVLQPASLSEFSVEVDVLIGCLSGTGERNPARYREIYVDGLRRVADRLRWRQEPRILFLSSTGVYGESAGEWVDERTPPAPLHPSGRVMLEAEEALHASYDGVCCLRLSGLYGPGRSRLVRQARRRGPFPKPDVWANQIHLQDVGSVAVQLLARPELPGTVLVSDDEPAKREDILSWIRAELGCPEGDLDEIQPEGVSRNRGNKRVSNRLLRSLGCRLQFPSYREGYRELLG